MALGKVSMSPGDTYPKWAGEPVASITDKCSEFMILFNGSSRVADGTSGSGTADEQSGLMARVDGTGKSALLAHPKTQKTITS